MTLSTRSPLTTTSDAKLSCKSFNYTTHVVHETFSYKQAQDAAKIAVPRLQKLGVAVFRPADYYAEMAKSDEHMQKVCWEHPVGCNTIVLPGSPTSSRGPEGQGQARERATS